MANVSVWKNVKVALESVRSAAVAVTAISKASPAQATAAAHGFANGDWILLIVQGMWQVNMMVVRAAAIAANTFQLEGVDSTLFDTFTSGNAYKLTLGTTISTATTISGDGGAFDFIDTTTIHDNTKSQVPGLPDPGKFTMDHIWDVSDAGLIAMKYASDNQLQKAILFTFPNGQKFIFIGYIGAALLPGGSAQDKVTTPSVFTIYGKPNVYAN